MCVCVCMRAFVCVWIESFSSERLSMPFNEPLKVSVLCWQSVNYRQACQGFRVCFPAGTHDFPAASIWAQGPAQPPIQCTRKMLKGFESSSRQVSHCSWFVCWMSLCVMKRGFVGTTQKQNISRWCLQATHKYSCIKRACWLCRVSRTYLIYLLAVLTDFLWFLWKCQTSHCVPYL